MEQDLATYVITGSLGWMFVGLVLAFIGGEIVFGSVRKYLRNKGDQSWKS
jgi:hypothetical protein